MPLRLAEELNNDDGDAIVGDLMLRVSRLPAASLYRLNAWLAAEEARAGGGQAVRLVAEPRSASTAPR